MKKTLYNLIWVALAGAALFCFSCSREKDVEIAQEVAGQAGNDGVALGDSVRTVTFRAVQKQETKAQFGTQDGDSWPTLWTNNDTEVKLSLNFGAAMAAGVTTSEDYRSASFTATIDFSGTSGPYTYYAVSPSSAALALSPSREAWKVSIPCEQTPTEGSADEGAIILASASAAYATMEEANVIDLFFGHLTAYGRMSLGNFTLQAGETVSDVELTVTTPFVGDWYWKYEMQQDDHVLIDYGASSTLTLNTSSTENIWFGCAPVDVSDELLVVSVHTNLGIYTQETLFPAGCKFTAGKVAMFTVDMAGCDFTPAGSGGGGTGAFELVTNASTLQAGDELLIVYTDDSKALGASAGNYRNPVTVSISNGSISSAGEASVLTLEAGYSAGTWAFKDGSKYLASQSGNNNYLKDVDELSDYASWTISIVNDGAATITAQSGTRTVLCYNTGSPRFSCYSPTNLQTLPSIYRRSGGGGGISASDPMLQKSEYGCYLGSGLEWALDAGVDQVTRSYDANDVLTYTLINPSEVEELEIRGYTKTKLKGDSVSVSVSWRRGTTTVHAGDYDMTLIKEQGPKVWLSDGAGKGFIIKK